MKNILCIKVLVLSPPLQHIQLWEEFRGLSEGTNSITTLSQASELDKLSNISSLWPFLLLQFSLLKLCHLCLQDSVPQYTDRSPTTCKHKCLHKALLCAEYTGKCKIIEIYGMSSLCQASYTL